MQLQGFYKTLYPCELEKKVKKMANRGIKVAVLEGDFAAICDLGLSFSLCLQLQSSDLKLCEAMWSAKSSSTGFSVSLFWPYGVSTERVKSKKKRSHRK